ncbi:hypothetical protein AB0G83_07435 [Streptomyces klenkii]|uniref:hypothetical protein n=1 Tax=Streptomyces klenkii TaxID=1420899 RepID=UPI0033F06E77
MIGLRYTIETPGGAVLGEWPAAGSSRQALRILGDALTEAERHGVCVADHRECLMLLDPDGLQAFLTECGPWCYEASGTVMELWPADAA